MSPLVSPLRRSSGFTARRRVRRVLFVTGVLGSLVALSGLAASRSGQVASIEAGNAASAEPPAGSNEATPIASRRLNGFYPAVPVRTIDGDTVEMRVSIWLGQDLTTRVRLRGIDAPELRARCEAERTGAEAAKARLEGLLRRPTLFLTDIGYDKYGTRVVARIVDEQDQDIGEVLLRERLARPYAGGKRQGWCEAEGAR